MRSLWNLTIGSLVLLVSVAGFDPGKLSMVQAQQESASSGSVQAVDPSRKPLPLNGGGAANADFDTLINLIQDVIPVEWETEDTITRFPSGVWIDTKGVMHRDGKAVAKSRFKAVDATQPALNRKLGKLQETEPLRWVSLTEIDQLVIDPEKRSQLASPAGVMVGGLARIDYLHWDGVDKQWYVGGPAGGFMLNEDGMLYQKESKLPPVLLEDLLTLAPVVLSGSGAFGCTIDPSETGLAEANQMLQDPKSIDLLRKNPNSFAEALGAKVGPQKLSLINLPEGCSTGLALLVADEHMKRVALEQVEQNVKVISYWKALAGQKSTSASTMVRWWFALAEQPVAKLNDSAAGCVDYMFDRSTVRVLSQAEWMQANGKRFEMQERDAAADMFAESFTANFEALQREHLVYGRLRQIFDWSVVLEVVRRESGSDPEKSLSGLRSWNNQIEQPAPLGTVDSLVAVKQLNNKSVSAVVSGGVLIETRKANFNRRASSQPGEDAKQLHVNESFRLQLR